MADAQVRLHLEKRDQGSVVTLEIDNSSRLNSLNTKLRM